MYIAVLLCSFLLPVMVNGQEIAIPVKSRGVPAYPFPADVSQPDGTLVTLTGKGDGVMHRAETPDGYTVLKDKKGWFTYAVKDESGNLVPSAYRVGASKGDIPPGIEKHLKYSASQADGFTKSYFQNTDTKDDSKYFPSTGTNNLLVILVEFPDMPSVIPREELDNLMNQENYNGTGSFRDFYLSSSYNSLTLENTVTAWVQVSRNMAYYGSNDEDGYDIRPQELAREAVDLAEAAGIDFSQFDNDKDGLVDELIIIHSGYGEEYYGTGDTAIWSHSWHLADLCVVYDDVLIDYYIMGPELRGYQGSNITNIGVICHEFGHSLGLPDFYDTDDDGSGGTAFDLNFWDLMADGSWNNDGAMPANNNAWSKNYLGWIDLPEFSAPGTYSLNSAVEHPEAYMIKTATHNEYFVLENRQQTGFDTYIPSSGMLIYHVDRNYPGWESNMINADPSHQGFDIEEADDIRSYATVHGDPFPGTSDNQTFSGSSVPGSNSWNNEETEISLHNISLSEGIITFHVLQSFPDPLPEGWQIDPGDFLYTGNITAQVILDTDTVASGYLGAFSGTGCRGIATVTYHPDSGWYFFELMCYSNALSEDTLTFRYYDPQPDSVYELYEQIEFISGMTLGEASDPIALHNCINFSKIFVTGWNWFSVNTIQHDMTLNHLDISCASEGDYIKNQTQSATFYEGFGWFGALKELDPSDLYLINAKSSCSINISGIPVNPETTVIPIASGWNWIGYHPRVALPVDEALASLTLAGGDYIKNQTRSATFYEGHGWFGMLEEMNPSEGYMMKKSGAGELLYPSGGETSSPTKSASVDDENDDLKLNLNDSEFLSFNYERLEGQHGWTCNPFDYEYNGEVNAVVIINGEEMHSGSLGVFVGDECRGYIDETLFFPVTGRYIFTIFCYSNESEGEVMTFKYYNDGDGLICDLEETIEFNYNMIEGDALAPLEFHNITAVNNPPEVISPLSDINLYEGFASATIDLAPVFSDPDGDNLSYTAVSGNPAVVAVAVSGTILTITEAGPGISAIAVTATDDGEGNLSNSDQFNVAVVEENELLIFHQDSMLNHGNIIDVCEDPEDIVLTVRSSAEWDFSTATTWMIITSANDSILNIACDANASLEERTGAVTIRDIRDHETIIYIRQSGDCSVGVIRNSVYLHMHVFPNPVENILYIELTGLAGHDILVEIFDATGTRCRQTEMTVDRSGRVQTDFSVFPNGLYLVRISDGATSGTVRVLRRQ